MKKLIFAIVIALIPFGISAASSDYYLKIDDIKGESSDSSRATNTNTNTNANINSNVNINTNTDSNSNTNDITNTNDPQEASVDYLIKLPPIDGDTESQAIEPDDIDVADDSQPITPDFGILLGGGGSDDTDEESQEQVAEILKNGMAEEGRPVESLSLNFEKIKTTVKHEVKLFGFIAIDTTAQVEIDADANVKVKFPWWSFLASGKDADNLGQEIMTTLSNILKKNSDTIKNALNNIR